MLDERAEIIKKGDKLGNHMIIRFRLPSGRDIFGFGTETVSTGDWSLGPTWCYFVPSAPAFLFDCGWQNLGGGNLLKMMAEVGFKAADIGSVVISHGHEDHDGGLPELIEATGLPVRSHPAHALLSRFYPDETPPGARSDFPASCWHCLMPSSFSEKHCAGYHKRRAGLQIRDIAGFENLYSDGTSVLHVPGHSPDSIAVAIGGEAILVGDSILPEITPQPTREAYFKKTAGVLRPLNMRGDQLYGIRAYIRSLKRLAALGKRFPGMLVLPAHRLYYNERWNGLSLQGRAQELLDHHLQRCGRMIEALKDGPKTAREIAVVEFEPRLLTGYGIYMAVNEILSHCELLAAAGDVVMDGDKIAITGSAHFEDLIDSITAGDE